MSDCTCQTTLTWTEASHVEGVVCMTDVKMNPTQCPLHEAADDLLAALEATLIAFHCPALDAEQSCYCNICNKARTAITKAKETK